MPNASFSTARARRAAVALALTAAACGPQEDDPGIIVDRFPKDAQIVQLQTDSLGEAVVRVASRWRLVFTPMGAPAYHRYLPNRVPASRPAPGARPEEPRPLIADGRALVPAFVAVGEREIEPALTTDSTAGRPVGGAEGGGGFVVHGEGWIVTSRRLAAGWHEPYAFDPRDSLGVLVDGRGEPVMRADGTPAVVRAPRGWVPGATMQTGPRRELDAYRGRNEFVSVALARRTFAFEARLARVSDGHDLALLKVDLPQLLPTLAPHDIHDSVRVGGHVAALGYPAAITATAGDSTPPAPALAFASVTTLVRADNGASHDGEGYELSMHDTARVAGLGSPVLDMQGRLVGVLSSRVRAGRRLPFVVPIRHAMVLTGPATPAP